MKPNESDFAVSQYMRRREYNPSSCPANAILRHRLEIAQNLYRKDLYAHFGCVNAIEFSNCGEWLVSGGDDRRVLVWNVEKATQGAGQPISMQGEHSSNIFCLGFDNHNSKIFSAGNDELVIVHDFATGETVDVYLHEEAVYGLSVDPTNDNIFASACDDGRILIWDIRERSVAEPFCLATYHSAFHAVMYNPAESRLLATANSKEGVGIWDIRKPNNLLIRFGAHPSASQSCMSVRFDRSGNHLLALRRRMPPVLYTVDNPTAECQFDNYGYYNSCTMKSCSFAGDQDQYILSGSDDFNLYLWKIPEDPLKDTWVSSAHMVLKGHRSIVNQVRFNPQSFVLASSGVEKIIKLWSPFEVPGSSGGIVSDSQSHDKSRHVYSHEEYISLVLRSGQVMSHDYSHQSTQEDPRMMAFFDSLVQREIEGTTSDSSFSSLNTSWLYSSIPDNLSELDNTTSDVISSEDEEGSDADGTDNTGGGRAGSADWRVRRHTLSVAFSSVLMGAALASSESSGLEDEEEEGEGDDDPAPPPLPAENEEPVPPPPPPLPEDDDAGIPDETVPGNNRISTLIAQKRAQLMREAGGAAPVVRRKPKRLYRQLSRRRRRRRRNRGIDAMTSSSSSTSHSSSSSNDSSSSSDEAEERVTTPSCGDGEGSKRRKSSRNKNKRPLEGSDSEGDQVPANKKRGSAGVNNKNTRTKDSKDEVDRGSRTSFKMNGASTSADFDTKNKPTGSTTSDSGVAGLNTPSSSSHNGRRNNASATVTSTSGSAATGSGGARADAGVEDEEEEEESVYVQFKRIKNRLERAHMRQYRRNNDQQQDDHHQSSN